MFSQPLHWVAKYDFQPAVRMYWASSRLNYSLFATSNVLGNYATVQ